MKTWLALLALLLGFMVVPAMAQWDDMSIRDNYQTHYTVHSGDYLSKIALEHTGDANRWPEMYQENLNQIDDPWWIYPGQQFSLPASWNRNSRTTSVYPGATGNENAAPVVERAGFIDMPGWPANPLGWLLLIAALLLVLLLLKQLFTPSSTNQSNSEVYLLRQELQGMGRMMDHLAQREERPIQIYNNHTINSHNPITGPREALEPEIVLVVIQERPVAEPTPATPAAHDGNGAQAAPADADYVI